jgi:hypothetical protein
MQQRASVPYALGATYSKPDTGAVPGGCILHSTPPVEPQRPSESARAQFDLSAQARQLSRFRVCLFTVQARAVPLYLCSALQKRLLAPAITGLTGCRRPVVRRTLPCFRHSSLSLGVAKGAFETLKNLETIASVWHPEMARSHAPAGVAVFAAALALLAVARPAAAGCNQGDLPCHCRDAGGYWETPPSPLMPTCKVKIWHQGRER